MFAIEFKKIVKSFPQKGGGTRVVLNDVTVRIRERELVSVVGPSGCGKSTLLGMLLGTVTPSSGEVLVGGEPVDGLGRDRGIVFQRYSLFPHLTVLENIAEGPLLERTSIPQRMACLPSYFRDKRESEEQAHEYLKLVGLTEADGAKFPFELSGGMRQRVALAQALVMKPKILMLDEPFGALDTQTREAMQLLLLRLWNEAQMTVLFVTHDLEEAVFLGTRIVAVSQYWSENGSGKPAIGAKVVYDAAIDEPQPRRTEFRFSELANTVMASVRRDALNPDYCQRRSEFVLTHPDAEKGGLG